MQKFHELTEMMPGGDGDKKYMDPRIRAYLTEGIRKFRGGERLEASFGLSSQQEPEPDNRPHNSFGGCHPECPPKPKTTQEWWACPTCNRGIGWPYCPYDGTPMPKVVEKSLAEKFMEHWDNPCCYGKHPSVICRTECFERIATDHFNSTKERAT